MLKGLSFKQILTVALGFIFLQVALVRQIFLILRAFMATKVLELLLQVLLLLLLSTILCLQIQSFINLIKISLIRKSIFTPQITSDLYMHQVFNQNESFSHTQSCRVLWK